MSANLSDKIHNTGGDHLLVEKFVEIINGKIIGSVSGYNYSEHDEEREGSYHSWPLGEGKGNAIFLIPAYSTYQVDEFQNIIVSKKIKFVRWKNHK